MTAMTMVGLLASACSLAPSSDALKTPSTCAIVPSTRVASILGRQVRTMNGEQARSSTNPRLLFDCYYLLPPPNGNHSLFIAEIELARSTESSSGLIKTLAKDTSVTGGSLHEIDGTVAAWNPYPANVGGGGRLTAIRKGSTVFVTITDEDAPDPLQSAISVMSYAFLRLDSGVRVPTA
jgi:hypothetical protein